MKRCPLLLPLLALPVALGFATKANPFVMVAAEGESSSVYVVCDDELIAGYNYYAYVYLDAKDTIDALSLEVHFDTSIIAVQETTNSIAATIYDSAIKENCVSYSYIFDSLEIQNRQRLFTFRFKVDKDAAANSSYFDIVVTEAYDSSLSNVDVSSSRKNFVVKENSSGQSARFFVNSSTISSSIGNEFTLSYTGSAYDAYSGSFLLQYDDTLFEFVSLNKGGFFGGGLFDYNANFEGQISISFALAERAKTNTLFSLTLRAKANITSESEVRFSCPELYDESLNLMVPNALTTVVSLAYDPFYEEHPALRTHYSLDEANRRINLEISLEKDSHLGAGDFVLGFPKEKATYVSYSKRFSPNFFTVNDKAQQLSLGQIKFSILSTSDIVDATNVIVFVFSYEASFSEETLSFTLSGSGLTDALTNPIALDVYGVEALVPASDPIAIWANEYLYMEDPSFAGDGSGRCRDEGLYISAKWALIALGEEAVERLRLNSEGKYDDALARYLAWASANEDVSPFQGNDIVRDTELVASLVTSPKDNPVMVLALTSSFAALFAIVVLALVKKKRRD